VFRFPEIEGKGFAVADHPDIPAAEFVAVAGGLDRLEERHVLAEGDRAGASYLAADADQRFCPFLIRSADDLHINGGLLVDAFRLVRLFRGGGDLLRLKAGDGQAGLQERQADSGGADPVGAVDFFLLTRWDAADGDLDGIPFTPAWRKERESGNNSAVAFIFIRREP
jgi:hypothetical protein